MNGNSERIRLDKWLWQARFFKSRALAARIVSEGVRVNGTRTTKPARAIGLGDVLTFTAGGRVRVVKLLACGLRRGPAPEARELYEDLSPEPQPRDPTASQVQNGGKPSRRERNQMEKLRRSLE